MAAQRAKPADKPKRKTHTKEIIALAANLNATPTEIAATLDIPLPTVHKSLERHGIGAKRLETFKKNRADILAAMQQKILKHVDEEKLKKTPAGSLVLAACQLYDKERLERNQSTANVATLHADIAAIKAMAVDK